MRLAVAATPEVALPTLHWLQTSEHDLVRVISQPDKPSGRGQGLHASPVSQWAIANSIDLVRLTNVEEIDAAIADVKQNTLVPVPMHLRDGHYAGAAKMGHGVGYQYAHDGAEGWVDQDYLGVDRQYYNPVDRGKESEFLVRLTELRNRRSSGHR